MSQLEQTIDIAAPPAAVFALIADEPEKMPEWWSALEVQARVTPAPTAVGSVARYVYNLMGMRIKGEHQVLTLERDARLVVRTISGIESMFDFTLAPLDDGGTRLTVRVAYRLPGSVLGQLINRRTIEQQNEQVAAESLRKLKLLVELETPA